MTPERFQAHAFGVTSDNLVIETVVGKHDNAWVIWAVLGGVRHAITQSKDLFLCCQWVAQLRRLEAAA